MDQLDFAPKEVLAHLTERFLQEQSWFWSRFAAFASLHAGAFVLVTSAVVDRKAEFGFAGALLAALWWIVQRFSLSYVKQSKRRYYAYHDDYIGFDRLLPEAVRRHRPESLMTDPRWSSSTTFGVATAGVVWAVWAFYLATL